jgi:hypothetical protein
MAETPQVPATPQASATPHLPETPQAPAVPAAAPTPVIRKGPRRATTEPVPGSDPSPAPEAARHTLTENDARLKAEKPPHY